jgi:hypothetical protein
MSPVVLYGDASEASTTHVTRLAQFLQGWINSEKNGDGVTFFPFCLFHSFSVLFFSILFFSSLIN